jgi:hypothetical protein
MTECEAVRARGGWVERRQAKGAQPPPPPPPRFLLLSSSTHDARGWQWSAALGTLQRTGVVSSFLRPTGPLKLKAPRQVSGRHSKAAEVGTGVFASASPLQLCCVSGGGVLSVSGHYTIPVFSQADEIFTRRHQATRMTRVFVTCVLPSSETRSAARGGRRGILVRIVCAMLENSSKNLKQF